jgi:hypothetical protein
MKIRKRVKVKIKKPEYEPAIKLKSLAPPLDYMPPFKPIYYTWEKFINDFPQKV